METEVDHRSRVRVALEGAGWRIDDEQPDRIEASDGESYGVAVFFEGASPVLIEYGDGERDLQCSERWHEAPGVLTPEEVPRLLGAGGPPPEWPRISPEEAARGLGGDPDEAREYAETFGPAEVEIGGETYTVWADEREEER